MTPDIYNILKVTDSDSLLGDSHLGVPCTHYKFYLYSIYL